MNKWTKKSLDLANSRGYLDKLSAIYPVSAEIKREIPVNLLEDIKKAYQERNKRALFKNVLALERFPFDDSYVASLRRFPELIEKNPSIVDGITNRLLSLTMEDLIKFASTPKSSSRRYGDSFRYWMHKIGIKFSDEKEFLKGKHTLLNGNDKKLGEFISHKFNLPEFEKGLDLVLKINQNFYIGEAKFISALGGSQGNQFDIAVKISKIKEKNLQGIAILDGIVWFNSRSKRYKTLIKSEDVIISALLLKDFIAENR